MGDFKRPGDRVRAVGAKLFFLLPFFSYVLIVNGAIPGILTPTLGQAVWITGFAKALADAPTWSIFAHEIGFPEPAAISFGLPGALLIAAGLKAGLAPPDAYSLACLLWLAVAFWGAYSLCRYFGSAALYSALGATIWLTFPIVWQHSGYSMLQMGIALLPAYYYSALRIIEGERYSAGHHAVFLVLCVASSFMDGYTFVMFATISVATIAFQFVKEVRPAGFLSNIAIVLSGFFLSYALYSLYSSSADFKASMDFFRGWGVDLSFLVVPAKGILWFPDFIGHSVARNPYKLFGDSSVYRTTFSLIPIVLAAALLFSPWGDKRMKVFMFCGALIALYLALGPSFKYNIALPDGVPRGGMPAEHAHGPTGTAFLWKHVPGFNNMRAVYRWMALALVGFWSVTMIALADRKMPRMCSYFALALLFIYNIPHLETLTRQYANTRSAFLRLDEDLGRELEAVFRPREMVAFLPAGNDFLVNFLAPRLNIRSYNIGGDKNFAIAQSHWPKDLLRATGARSPAAFTASVLRVLSGTANVVAVPFLDLLMAAHQWPSRKHKFDEMQPYVEHLQKSGLFEIAITENFAIVRLSSEVEALPVEARLELLDMAKCPVDTPSTLQVRLAHSEKLSFSEVANVCGTGWSGVERWGRWTEGNSADLYYTLPRPAAERDVLELDVRSFVSGDPPRQRVGIRVNGKAASEWVFTRETVRQIQRIEIPRGATKLHVEFAIPDARSPKQTGTSEDARVLGIGVSALCLTEADKACLARE